MRSSVNVLVKEEELEHGKGANQDGQCSGGRTLEAEGRASAKARGQEPTY